MDKKERFDSLIQYHTEAHWPDQDWRLIKAVAVVESGLDPQAWSDAGARGLMQIMPQTFTEIWRKHEPVIPYGRDDPDSSLAAGTLYLREQYERFPEIECPDERLLFALASYNCGRGYVNKAIELARNAGEDWQCWETAKQWMASPGCEVGGRRPEFLQTWRYVEKVQAELETPS